MSTKGKTPSARISACEEYMSRPHVGDFVKWMSGNLDSSTFMHKYKDRRSAENWQVTSLFNAYQKYNWRFPELALNKGAIPAGADFESSRKALSTLQERLRNAIDKRKDEAARDACILVMTWGGVRNGNVIWLTNHTNGLAMLLAETQDALNGGDLNNPLLRKRDLRFNAGMTKVYSLLCERFIIYDSRVAAALGWAVVKFCSAGTHTLSGVPDDLAFPWSPAKESKGENIPKQRNPTSGQWEFPRLSSPTEHAKWNLRASWLLGSVLKHSAAKKSAFTKEYLDLATRLRALESALFMIGYDLQSSPQEIVHST